MDQHGHLPGVEAECDCGIVVEDVLDPLQLHEVVPRASGAELPAATLPGALRDGRRIRSFEPALRLRPFDVVLGADPALRDEHARTIQEDAIEVAAAEVERAAAPGAGRDSP